ncbi:MAG: DUF3261 domain-containing protein [Parvibaculaceae bacterium]
MTLPEMPSFGDNGEVIQLVRASYQGHQQMFQSAISAKSKRFVVVMSVPSGPRIMRIEWTPNNLATRKESLAPNGLSSEHMLVDLMLVYGSDADVRKSIEGATFVQSYPTERKVIKNGKVLIEVTRPKGDIWNGHSLLINHAFGYQLDIQSRRATDD